MGPPTLGLVAQPYGNLGNSVASILTTLTHTPLIAGSHLIELERVTGKKHNGRICTLRQERGA